MTAKLAADRRRAFRTAGRSLVSPSCSAPATIPRVVATASVS